EEKKFAQLWMLEGGDERRVGQAVGQFYGCDYVIKAVVSRHVACDGAAFVVNDHVVGLHANFAQHGAHQGGFVFAIPIMMGKNIGSRMWLKTADTQLYCNVAYVMLHKTADHLHL